MGASYVPEIFMPSEKRILSPAFHDSYFVPPLGFPLPPHQPAKRLCATCVIFLFGAEFGLCALLRCVGCFFGAFHRIEKQPAQYSVSCSSYIFQ